MPGLPDLRQDAAGSDHEQIKHSGGSGPSVTSCSPTPRTMQLLDD